MNISIGLGIVIAVVIYVSLCFQIISGSIRQNFATWVLWVLLDAIAATSIIFRGGNFWLPIAYAAGSAATAISILKSRNFSWTWVESFTAGLVFLCLVIWAISNAQIATIASTIAVVLAGVPQAMEMYKNPWEAPFIIYLGFFISNTLSVLGGKNWSIEQVYYPLYGSISCFIVVVIIARKFWLKPSRLTTVE